MGEQRTVVSKLTNLLKLYHLSFVAVNDILQRRNLVVEQDGKTFIAIRWFTKCEGTFNFSLVIDEERLVRTYRGSAPSRVVYRGTHADSGTCIMGTLRRELHALEFMQDLSNENHLVFTIAVFGKVRQVTCIWLHASLEVFVVCCRCKHSYSGQPKQLIDAVIVYARGRTLEKGCLHRAEVRGVGLYGG